MLKYLNGNLVILYCLLFSVLLIFSYSCRNKPIDMIVIKSVEPRYETPYSISCEEFDYAFHDKIQIDTIKDDKFLSKFSAELSKLKIDTSNYFPDVRIKIEIYTDYGVSILCGDYYNYMLNLRPMLTNEELNKLIDELFLKKRNKENK